MLSETVRATIDTLEAELPARVICPVCGRPEDGAEMRAVEVVVGPFTEVDLGEDIEADPRIGRAFARVVKLEWRCRVCRDGEPAAGVVL